MRLDPLNESQDIEDRRGQSGGRFGSGGGRLGLGSLVLAGIAYFFFGVNPSTTLSGLEAVQSIGTSSGSAPVATNGVQQRDASSVFASKILQSTKDVWSDEFKKAGGSYKAPVMVLYEGRTQTACGIGQAVAGPFYCPADQKIYLDLSFFRQMSQQMGAEGDFAQAYVIAHEVGHHIQNQMGIEQQVSAARSRMNEVGSNALSIRVELQADCFSGVWAAKAHASSQLLESGDIEEGLNAAHQVGDDSLQKQSQGYVVPDSFTHGTSAQRVRWFSRGLKTADWQQCDTFNAHIL